MLQTHQLAFWILPWQHVYVYGKREEINARFPRTSCLVASHNLEFAEVRYLHHQLNQVMLFNNFLTLLDNISEVWAESLQQHMDMGNHHAVMGEHQTKPQDCRERMSTCCGQTEDEALRLQRACPHAVDSSEIKGWPNTCRYLQITR